MYRRLGLPIDESGLFRGLRVMPNPEIPWAEIPEITLPADQRLTVILVTLMRLLPPSVGRPQSDLRELLRQFLDNINGGLRAAEESRNIRDGRPITWTALLTLIRIIDPGWLPEDFS